jgi:hypothetical protein
MHLKKASTPTRHDEEGAGRVRVRAQAGIDPIGRSRRSDRTVLHGRPELLIDDEHELVQKATGSWLREAGKRDPKPLIAFLERHAATMNRASARAS